MFAEKMHPNILHAARTNGGQWAARRPGVSMARSRFALLLSLVTLSSHDSAICARAAGLEAICGFIPVPVRQMVLGRSGSCPRAKGVKAGGLLASRMNGRDGDRRDNARGMNELERAREALANIIAKRKAQGSNVGSSTVARALASQDPVIDGPAGAKEKLGAKMAATFPLTSSAKEQQPLTSAIPQKKSSHVTGDAAGGSGASGVSDAGSASTAAESRAGTGRKGKRVVSAVPPVQWAVPEEEWSIVNGDASSVIQAKMNLKEFEAANSGWADGQDWAVDTNYAKGSDAPAAAQLGARRRGKGAGVQAQVNEIFRRAKFTGKTDEKKLTSSNWKDDWVKVVVDGDEVGESGEQARDGESGKEARETDGTKAAGTEDVATRDISDNAATRGAAQRGGSNLDSEGQARVSAMPSKEHDVVSDKHGADLPPSSQRPPTTSAPTASPSPPPSPVTCFTPPPPPRPPACDMSPPRDGSPAGRDGGAGGGGKHTGGGWGGVSTTVSSICVAASPTSVTPPSSASAETSPHAQSLKAEEAAIAKAGVIAARADARMLADDEASSHATSAQQDHGILNASKSWSSVEGAALEVEQGEAALELKALEGAALEMEQREAVAEGDTRTLEVEQGEAVAEGDTRTASKGIVESKVATPKEAGPKAAQVAKGEGDGARTGARPVGRSRQDAEDVNVHGSLTDLIDTLKRITNEQRSAEHGMQQLQLREEPEPQNDKQKMDTQAQQFFKSAVAEVAKSIQSKRFSSRRSSRSGEEDWNNYLRKISGKETVSSILARLEAEGIIDPPELPKDPFVVAFENMTYNTPVPLAPLQARASFAGGAPLGEPRSAGAAGVGSVEEWKAAETEAVAHEEQAAVGMHGTSGVLAEDRAVDDAEEQNLRRSDDPWNQDDMDKGTMAKPGTVAAMLEGFTLLDGEDDEEDEFMGEHDDCMEERKAAEDIFSHHFHTASPTESTVTFDDLEDGKEDSKEEDMQVVKLRAVDNTSMVLQQQQQQPRSHLPKHTQAPTDRSGRDTDTVRRELDSSSSIPPASPAGPQTYTNPLPLPPSVAPATSLDSANSTTASASHSTEVVNEDEEDLGYEIRVVYVTDTTIGLRTTWDDGFEVVEEILLATGDLAHTETAESTPPPAKAVPRSEAILRDDIREDGEEWKRTKPTEKVDRRVQWASAHDLGISKGMLVQVKATSKSRYRKLKGLVTTVVGNGKRVRVQFAGMRVTALLQASSLESVDLDGSGSERDASQSGRGENAGGATRMSALGGMAGRFGEASHWRNGLAISSGICAKAGFFGTIQRLVPDRVGSAIRPGMGRMGCMRGSRIYAPCLHVGCLHSVRTGAGDGEDDAVTSSEQSLREGPLKSGGGMVEASRDQGLIAGSGSAGSGSLPLGFPFRRPAKGSESNPCVQGDMQSWVEELYGASGRRYKGGPLRPRAARLMQEKFTDKHPARAYFESLSPTEQVQAMQIQAEYEEEEIQERRRYADLLERRKEEEAIAALTPAQQKLRLVLMEAQQRRKRARQRSITAAYTWKYRESRRQERLQGQREQVQQKQLQSQPSGTLQDQVRTNAADLSQLSGGLKLDANGLLKAPSGARSPQNVSADVNRVADDKVKETIREMHAALARKEYHDSMRRREMLEQGLSPDEVERMVPRSLSVAEAVTMGAEGQALLLQQMITARLQELDLLVEDERKGGLGHETSAQVSDEKMQREVLCDLNRQTQATLQALVARKRNSQRLVRDQGKPRMDEERVQMERGDGYPDGIGGGLGGLKMTSRRVGCSSSGSWGCGSFARLVGSLSQRTRAKGSSKHVLRAVSPDSMDVLSQHDGKGREKKCDTVKTAGRTNAPAHENGEQCVTRKDDLASGSGSKKAYVYIAGGKFGDFKSDEIDGGKYPRVETMRCSVQDDGVGWEWVGNLSTGERTLSAMATLDGALYHLGGRSLFYPQRHMERYDVALGTWEVVCNMTVGRRGLGLCILPGEDCGGPDRLYAAGGQDANPLKSVEVFDAANETWSQVAPMGDKRVNFGFTALEGNLYAIGGWNGETILQSCEKYYPDRDEWVEIAELPYPLCLMQVGVLCGKLYVVGGFQGLPGGLGADVTVDLTSTEGWTATILSFDPQVGGWHQEDISLREARSDHAMVIHDGRLLVLGGYNGVDRLSCVESFGVGDTETRVEHHLQLPMPARNFAASMLQVE